MHNAMNQLFLLDDCQSKRFSSFDLTGGNHDWMDLEPGETRALMDYTGCGIIRHLWMTCWVGDENWQEEPLHLSRLTLRMYWDGETEPSVEAPLGDFFGLGFGQRTVYQSAMFAVNPEDGRAMNCYFPMPFEKAARLTITCECEHHCNFYYYVDCELRDALPTGTVGYFHAQWRRENNTYGWAPLEPGLLDREKANVPEEPAWAPKAWQRKNLDGRDNYTILDAEGCGKFVGCNLYIDVFSKQANAWYGEGDDMFFIDGEAWPPSLHGTGTEDYFSTAFCPTQPYCASYSGLTRYSGKKDDPEGKFLGKNAMYRLHILDPVHFRRSLLFSIEHGHANKLSNDYTSVAYWYQTEPHKVFPSFPALSHRLPRP